MFLISREDLLDFSMQFPNKPIAFAFYIFAFEREIQEFSLSNIQNFWNKVDVETGLLQIRFDDDSVFALIDGVVNVFHQKTNYFATFNLR